MELYEQILTNLLAQGEVRVTFTNGNLDLNELVKDSCYHALSEIKSVIEDDELDDKECFERIERIVEIFESIGSNGGFRHDFG